MFVGTYETWKKKNPNLAKKRNRVINLINADFYEVDADSINNSRIYRKNKMPLSDHEIAKQYSNFFVFMR